jgi:hypothetical protein
MKQKMIAIIETDSAKRQKFCNFFTLKLANYNNDVHVLANIDQAPAEIDLVAVLIHKGDQSYWQKITDSAHIESLQPLESLIHNKYSPEKTKLFWFNSTGIKSLGDMFRSHNNVCISKRISLAEIELTDRDISEIIEFSIGNRKILPTCCFDPLPQQRLIALSILCQAYLIKYKASIDDDPKLLQIQQPSWWFDVLLNQQELNQYTANNDKKEIIENSLEEYELIDIAIRTLFESIQKQNLTDPIVRNAYNSITNIIQSY